MKIITIDRAVVEQALEALDVGVPISPGSVLHDRLRAALAQERQTSHSAEQERGMAQPVERTCGQQTARKLT